MWMNSHADSRPMNYLSIEEVRQRLELGLKADNPAILTAWNCRPTEGWSNPAVPIAYIMTINTVSVDGHFSLKRLVDDGTIFNWQTQTCLHNSLMKHTHHSIVFGTLLRAVAIRVHNGGC